MSYPVLKFAQPAGDFYLTTMSAVDAIRIAKIERREFDVELLDTTGGVQRGATFRRVSEIAAYCDTADAAFPTPILLAVNEGDYDLDDQNQTIRFEASTSFATVVDGQHRLMGIEKCSDPSKFYLPVVLLLDATLEQQALLFAIINGKQTRVPPSLIYDLFGLTRNRSPQKTAHEIARGLNSKPESPWERRIKMLGKRTDQSDAESLTQGTFVGQLLPHISAHADADFAAARKGEVIAPSPSSVFNRYFIANEDAAILRILENLFGAQRKVWPEEWADSKNFILSRSTGFMATMRALPRIVRHGQSMKDLTEEHFVRVFRLADEALRADARSLVTDEFASSGAGINVLREYFEHAVDVEAALPHPLGANEVSASETAASSSNH